MRVFKFGGASVKDAEAFFNVFRILQDHLDSSLWVVVSAIGKTTNHLEELHSLWRKGQLTDSSWKPLFDLHSKIAQPLGLDGQQHQWLTIWKELTQKAQQEPVGHFDQTYDDWVSYGELLSTSLLSEWCNTQGLKNQWVDARQWLTTDERYRDARVQWEFTQHQLRAIPPHSITITQGFIGHSGVSTTTLGREGSDYTAAIIAHCLDAEELIIWKDVPGMLNADPKKFDDAIFIPQLSYREALELAYYGASVIHPKTIQPLQSKNIPLNIRSFIQPQSAGTLITQSGSDQYPTCTIVKEKQTLLSISTKDGSFVVEDNIMEIFHHLIHIGIKVQLMENSALSFSLCVQAENEKMEELYEVLQKKYHIKYNFPVTLVTLRHYQEADLKKWNQPVLLEQKNRSTIRWVMESSVQQ